MGRVGRIAAVLLLLASGALALDAEVRKQARDPDSFERSKAARKLGKDGSAEAAILLRELLADPNPYVRDHAVIACGDLEDEKAVAALGGATGARETLTRRNLAEALGRTKSPAALPIIGKLARKDRAPEVRAQALDFSWGYRGNVEVLSLCREAASDRSPMVRAAAVEAAGRIQADGALDLVRAALEDEDEGVRCVARMELRFLEPGAAVAGLAGMARDASWRIRAQAVDDAFALREAPAVEALVMLVADDVLAVSFAAHRALRRLSGKEIDRDPELWRAWWEAAKKDWRPPKGSPDRDDAATPGRSVARFHGIGVSSDRVAFVLDSSGSMAEPLPGDAKERTRWEAVRDELERTLSAMPDGARVNLVVFGERPSAALPRPAPLGRGTRTRLGKFAGRTVPGERGNLLGAMLHALSQEDVDTILLLTDGAPSAGEMVDKGRVRNTIRQLNRMRKVRIHTIGYGSAKSSERRFMEGLARDSGGVSVFR